MATGFWTRHWRRVPAVDRFLRLDVRDAEAVCPGKQPVEPLPSWENRLFRCGDRVVKFYRPGRWSKAGIEEEHRFIQDLEEDGIPVVYPVNLVERQGIMVGIFELIGGRERHAGIREEEALVIGRLLARIHNVGAERDAPNRALFDVRDFGMGNMAYLMGHAGLPEETARDMLKAVEEIIDRTADQFEALPAIRIHGDAGLGNMIWTETGPVVYDFDDMLVGPAVLDVWLMGREAEVANLDAVVTGYRAVRALPEEWLDLIPALEALRLVWGCAWMLSRHYDPIFRDNLAGFGTEDYWNEQLETLQTRLREL